MCEADLIRDFRRDIHVARFALDRYARELGFEVSAVRELLALSEQPDRPCAKVDGIARRHSRTLTAALRSSLPSAVLQRSLDACGHGRVGECRVIGALAEQAAA